MRKKSILCNYKDQGIQIIYHLGNLLMQMRISRSPVLLLTIITVAIFFSEGLIMLLLSLLPRLSIWAGAIFDSTLLVALLFPILYFLVLRQSRLHIDKILKTNEQLQTEISDRKKVEEALRASEKQLRYLSSQLLTTQEQERRRISMELHDELGQALSILKIRLSHIGEKIRVDQKSEKEECLNMLQYIDQVIENVRRLSWDLSPSILIDLGLTAALRRLVNEFVKHHHIRVSFNVETIDHLFSEKGQITLYRIFQEALTNIGKYAQAKNVSIFGKKQDGMISFFIEDDGRGFNIEEFTLRNGSEKGLGLATMRERAWMLGGSLDLKSQRGRGTQVSFSIPLREGEN